MIDCDMIVCPDGPLSSVGIEKLLESIEPIFDLSPDPSVLTRASDGQIVWANRAFLEFTGRSKTELIGSLTDEIGLWPEGERSRMKAALEREGHLENFEARLRCGGGLTRYVLISTRLVMSKTGIFQFLTARDATEIRKIEDQLKSSRMNYRNLVDFAAVPIIVHCADEVVYANAAALKALGASSFSDLKGKTPFDLIHPDDREDTVRRIMQLLQTGEPSPPFDQRLVRLDGTVFPARVVGTACDFEGRPGIQVVVIDTTEQRLIEQRYRMLFEESPVPLWEQDLSALLARISELRGNGTTELRQAVASNPAMAAEFLGLIRIVDVNRATLKLYGARFKEEVTRSFRQIAGEEGVSVFLRILAQMAQGGTTVSTECSNYTLDGRKLEVMMTFTRLDAFPGGDKRALISVVDISQSKELERTQAEAKRRAEEASVAKSSFVANMSHEIRTPLNGIFGMLQILATSNLSAQQKTIVDMALASGRNLLTVINDVLDFSKIEAGRITLKIEPFRLRPLLATVLDLFAEAAREKSITLELSPGPALPDCWEGDAGKLRQILLNLVGNAIKFTMQGRVSIVVSASEKGLRFEVTDTGIGISPANIAIIFEPFIQVENSYQRKYQGSGLGLGIVKKLVELMGGNITVTSEEGKGSRFSFEVPLKRLDHEIAPECQESLKSQNSPAVPLEILVVEDNTVNQIALKMMLESSGHRVQIASSGTEAVKIFSSAKFDCVLMDIQMPGMDGFATTAKLRDTAVFGEKAGTPVIAVTAHAIAGDKERCMNAGMTGYLTKPFVLSELLALLPNRAQKDRS